MRNAEAWKIVQHTRTPPHSNKNDSYNKPGANNRVFFQMPDTDRRLHHKRFFNIGMIFDNAAQHHLFL